MNKIINGDCIEEMKKLKENSVDAIITDPPYNIGSLKSETLFYPKDSLPKLQETYGVNLDGLKIDFDKRKILRNMVNPELGLQIFKMAFKEKQQTIK